MRENKKQPDLTLEEIQDIINHIYLLVFFLMPIKTVLDEEEKIEIEEKYGESVIMIEEQSRETFKAAECLKLASRWIGIKREKIEPQRITDEPPTPSAPSKPVSSNEQEDTYSSFPYEKKVKKLTERIYEVTLLLSNLSIDKILPISNRIQKVDMYLSEAIFWLEWEYQRYSEEGKQNDNIIKL